MLVPLVNPNWPLSKQQTITKKMQALADEQGEDLKEMTDIASLGDGEPLWLYSHGSASTFAGQSEARLAGWLLKNAGMPPGERDVVLKGCATQSYATRLQKLINKEKGYEQVVVYGFEGAASMTTGEGEMLVRVGTEKVKKEASRQGALAQLAAMRDTKQGESKVEREKRAAEAKKQAQRDVLVKGTIRDDGLSTYIAADDRAQRRYNRTGPTTTTQTQVDSDSETEAMDVDDSNMQV